MEGSAAEYKSSENEEKDGERWRTLPNTNFKRVWRHKFARSIPKLGKENTTTTTILTTLTLV